MIVKRVDEELRLAENKKRTREAADEHADMSKRAKLAHVGSAVTGFPHGTTPPAQAVGKSSVGELGVDEPSVGELGADEPSVGELGVGEPSVGEPSAGELTIQVADAEGDFSAFETVSITAYSAPVHSEINWLGYWET